MPLEKATWDLNLVGVSEDRRVNPASVRWRSLTRACGIDGNFEGGVTPHPGLLLYFQIDPTQEASNTRAINGLTGSNTATNRPFAQSPRPSHNGYSVTEAWPVEFKVGATEFAYGFVYRVSGTYGNVVGTGDGVNDGLHIAYRIGSSTTWFHRELERGIPAAAPADVTAYGRYVFVGVSGRSPLLFWVVNNSGTYTENVLGDTNISANATPTRTASEPGPGSQSPTVTAIESSLTAGDAASPTGTQPGSGKFYLTGTTPQTVPTSGTGGYTLGVRPQTTANGAVQTVRKGVYQLAFRLFDSRSGRRSALSQTATFQTTDFGTNSTRYLALELVYDSSKFDTVELYRSVRANTPTESSILHLDASRELTAYEINPSVTAPLKRALIYYSLNDQALALQDPYLLTSTHLTRMPPGNALLNYENTLLVGGITPYSNTDTENFGIGEVRWSSLADRSPELFSPAGYRVPDTLEDVLAFARVSGIAVGFAPNNLQYFRKQSVYLYSQAMHEGHGIVGKRALAVEGNSIYYISQTGLKSVDASGVRTAHDVLNYRIQNEWKANLSSLSMAYDAASSSLYIFNPTTQEAQCLWMNTGRVTSLCDLSFLNCFSARAPRTLSSGWNASTNGLIQRALFLRSTGTGPTGTYALYAFDHFRTSTAYTLFPLSSSILTQTSSNATTSASGSFLVPVTSSVPSDCIGLYAYNLNNPTVRYRVHPDSSSTNLILEGDLSSWSGTGNTIGLSPIVVDVVSASLPLYDFHARPIEEPDFFRTRHMDTGGVAFSSVGGTSSGQPYATYFVQSYEGDTFSPITSNRPIDQSNAPVVGVQNGEPTFVAAVGSTVAERYGFDSPTLRAGFRIACPGLTFVAYSMRIVGAFQASDRTKRA